MNETGIKTYSYKNISKVTTDLEQIFMNKSLVGIGYRLAFQIHGKV